MHVATYKNKVKKYTQNHLNQKSHIQKLFNDVAIAFIWTHSTFRISTYCLGKSFLTRIYTIYVIYLLIFPLFFYLQKLCGMFALIIGSFWLLDSLKVLVSFQPYSMSIYQEYEFNMYNI